MLPLLESAPALQRLLLPLSLPQTGIPLEVSGCTRGHAATLHLAGILLLLPAGDLRPAGFLPVSGAYLGSADGSAAHLQGLEGTSSKSHLQEQLTAMTAKLTSFFFCFFFPPDTV